ncbi:MAG: redoxin domain-containing protein [Saprospiraceae bacterium]|nr:redoxin domain-containing protein [Saprospiraceae bacterium]
MIRLVLTSLLFLSFSGLRAQTQLDTAVNFTVVDVHQNQHELFEYLDQGKFVVLDFFYTTCAPCIGTIPEMNWAMQHYGCNQEDLVMLSIDYGNTDLEVLQYQATYGALIPAVSGLDGGGNEVVATYGIYAFPTVILIAPDRIIINQDIFPISNANIVGAIEGQAGISASLPCEVNVTALSEQEAQQSSFELFPNPATSFCTIRFPDPYSGPLDYILLDGTGRQVRSGRLSETEPRISLQNLGSGIYFFSLFSEGNRISSRTLVVE